MPVFPPSSGTLDVEFFKSPVLNGRRSYWIYLPAGYDRPGASLPVVYLLHGLHGAESDWVKKGLAHETASRLLTEGRIVPMILVCPSDGLAFDGTGYLNRFDGSGRYEDYIARDLVDHIDSTYPVLRDRRARAITGLSMGGFGAMNLALHHPELFCSVASHSGLFFHAFEEETSGLTPEHRRANSPYYLVGEHPEAVAQLRIYFDCGRDDFLYSQNEAFDQRLTELGVPHVYHRFSGGHSWEYWTEHLVDSLLFHSESFRASGGGK